MTDQIKSLAELGLTPPEYIRRMAIQNLLKSDSNSEIKRLQSGLKEANEIINKMEEQKSYQNQTLVQDLKQLLDNANQATKTIFAEVEIPSPEYMKIKLAPLHWFESLDQHRSDGSVANLCIGLFGGGCLGMIGSWFIGNQFPLNPPAIILFVIMLILTSISIFGSIVYKKRANSLSDKISNFSSKWMSI